MRFKHYILLLALTLLYSCEQEVTNPDKLVVEGWITANQHPVVLVHKSYSMTDPSHQDDIEQNTQFDSVILRQMLPLTRVAINDGNQEIVLTGRIDQRYMPPIVFTTTDIIGEKGKSYQLTVDYKDLHAEGSSELLTPISFDSITAKLNVEEKQVYLKMHLSHLPTEECYFMVMYRSMGAVQYTLAPFTVKSAAQVDANGEMVIAINQRVNGLVNIQPFSISQSQYVFRLARIGKAEYDYFTALSDLMMTQGIFFVPIFGNPPSNVTGALGYWSAMATKDCAIIMNCDSTYLP